MKQKDFKLPEFHNTALSRMIRDAENPYHTLHVNKAFEVKKAKLDKFSTGPEKQPLGNPWLIMK